MDTLNNNIRSLTDKEFSTISHFMETNVGIKMPASKRIMVQSRLMHRLRKLNFTDFSQYLDYVFSQDRSGEELIFMIDNLTTNKTEFFREADHFAYMTNTVLPQKIQENKRSLKIWSAGCSSGEEPYTLSIVMREFMRANPGKISEYSILATDISTRVLDMASNAVYDESEIADMTTDLKQRYFLKSKDPTKKQVRIKQELRKNVYFKRLNFMDHAYPIGDTFNIIFCRNVLIYFDKPTQEAIISKLLQHLEIGGYLFLGHSETIFAMNLPLKTVAPTVYQKINTVSAL